MKNPLFVKGVHLNIAARLLRALPLLLFFITLCALGDGESVFILIFLIAAHETAHWLTLRLLGGGGSFFSVTGGLRLSQSAPISYPRELCVLLAGPSANLTLCIFFYLIGAKSLFAQSLALGLFNLLPIRSLDGGRALLVTLSLFMPLHVAQRTAELISALTSFFLVFLSLYLVFRTGYGSYFIFLSFLCLSEHFFNQNRKNIPKARKKEEKRENKSISKFN